jgi:Family of unknown function (DUF6459)
MSLRLVKVPDAAPPYDCPTHGAGCPALDAATGGSDPVRDRGPLPVRDRGPLPVPVPATGSGGSAAPASAPGAASAVGPAGVLPWQFAQVIVEIMAGLRPQKQIIGLTTDHAREQARRLAPLLASDRRPGIQRIMTSRPTARVVEMTVIVSIGARSRALAMRLEHTAARPATPGRPGRPARWLCTAIEAG